MKLTDVEFQGDNKKATFFYIANERVDFRELVRELAGKFGIRIDMRQIGARQSCKSWWYRILWKGALLFGLAFRL